MVSCYFHGSKLILIIHIVSIQIHILIDEFDHSVGSEFIISRTTFSDARK